MRRRVVLLGLLASLTACGRDRAPAPAAEAEAQVDSTLPPIGPMANVDGRDLLGRDEPPLPELPAADTTSAVEFADLTSSLKFLASVTSRLRQVRPEDCSGPTPVALQWADSARIWSQDFSARVEHLATSPVVQQAAVRPVWQQLMLQTNNLLRQTTRMEQLLALKPPAPDLLRGWAQETDAIIDRVLPLIIRVGPAFETGIHRDDPGTPPPAP